MDTDAGVLVFALCYTVVMYVLLLTILKWFVRPGDETFPRE